MERKVLPATCNFISLSLSFFPSSFRRRRDSLDLICEIVHILDLCPHTNSHNRAFISGRPDRAEPTLAARNLNGPRKQAGCCLYAHCNLPFALLFLFLLLLHTATRLFSPRVKLLFFSWSLVRSRNREISRDNVAYRANRPEARPSAFLYVLRAQKGER